jgi:hypothetical protein
MNRSLAALIAAPLALMALTACGSDSGYANTAYDDDLYASAVCVDARGIRVPDDFCPIGDGGSNQGFLWNYRPYHSSDNDVDVVLVGYPVDRTVYVPTRPSRVSTLHIDRGRAPYSLPVGSAPASSVRVPTLAAEQRKSSIQRGGFGAPNARASGSPVPARGLDSAAPGRGTDSKAAGANTAARSVAAPRPAPTPKAPSSRSFGSSSGSSSKSGKK